MIAFTTGRTWRRLSARIVLLVLVGLVAAQVFRGYSDLRETERAFAARGLVLKVRGGDVDLRDIPKTFQILDGRLLSDPHYEGEPHWYPFLGPLTVAAISRLSNMRVPSAYFVFDLAAVALFAAAAGAYVWRVSRSWFFVAMPAAIALGLFGCGAGIYPIATVRGPLLLCLLAGSAVLPSRTLRGRAKAGALFGLCIGVLGLWNGAAFFTGVAAGAAICCLSFARRFWPAGKMRYSVATLGSIVLGTALPMCLFAVPQWLRYGTIRQAGSARIWLEATYAGGHSLRQALEFPLVPRGMDALLIAATLLWTTRLVQPRAEARWAARLLLGAYGFALAMAHLGYGLHDPAWPRFSEWLRNSMPSPPHTFGILSSWILVLVRVLGLAAALEVAAKGLRRILSKWFAVLGWVRRSFWTVVPVVLAILAVRTSAHTFDRWQEPVNVEFCRFARTASRIAGRTTVFARDPITLAGLAAFRWLYFPAQDHTNHYVQSERLGAAQQLDGAISRGDWATANEILTRYRVEHFVESSSTDPVVVHCGGQTEAEGPGIRLRRRTVCSGASRL